MKEIEKKNAGTEVEVVPQEITIENRLEMIEDGLRKNYLARLSEMEIASTVDLPPLEDDIIDNIRLYHITEMVYEKGEPATDKFTTVFNTLSTYNATVFIVLDSDGKKTDFYLGVRNNETDESKKRSSVTLGDTLKNTLIGHFPGIKIASEDRFQIAELSKKIASQHNVTSVSVVGNSKSKQERSEEQFVQGLEKLALAMQGREYTGMIVAQSQTPQAVQQERRNLQNLYTQLSPYQKIQFTDSNTSGTSRSKSFAEMDGKQKAAMIGGAAVSIVGMVAGVAGVSMAVNAASNAANAAAIAANTAIKATGLNVTGASVGSMIGGQFGGQITGIINTFVPTEQISESKSTSTSSTTENRQVTDILHSIDETINRTNEFDSYGMWNVAGYFVSDDMSAAEIAASNYRSLMNGEYSGRELAAINSWRSLNPALEGDFNDLTEYLSRFAHPKFKYGVHDDFAYYVDATTEISGKELGLHLGLPRATVPGLPVIKHAEFGKEVNTYHVFDRKEELRPEDRITLGRVFDLGQITNKKVELNNKSLNMHTFITGSTGSGKSNTVYQLLTELHQDRIPFLVVEPAKGEYKDVFGNWDDVNVYSTNPNIAQLVNLNPFKFPDSIHVLEHVDGLVEIFSVCWPMYDAMPAFFKDAILKSYEAVGWDLGSSTFDGDEVEYPDFEVLAEQLDILIGSSDYASDIKSNYRGALITRVKSLTVGLNKFIFTADQTSYEKLFDENCILDISRVKSGETKALIMGLMVYILNEYRVDRKKESNEGLRHITVLEEAHNLLKSTTAGTGESNLIGKSVEMLTNTIAEIRTYGEGFIIVDQSPSSVDIAAIKNTNTKIVLRTPEANDREAVGHSMGLNEDQINEIAKLPSGVAVVYQNDWVSPVLTLIDKADVVEKDYVNPIPMHIKPLKEARTEIICALLQPWLQKDRIRGKQLLNDLKSLDMSRYYRNKISDFIEQYVFLGGRMIWGVDEIPMLQSCLMSLLYLTDTEFKKILLSGSADMLRTFVREKTTGLEDDDIDEICNVLTKVEGISDDND